MKERPILFSAPMVRAILEGSKTQTRRSYKPRSPEPYEYVETNVYEEGDAVVYQMDDAGMYSERHCPYGQVGDRLWVRETWGIDDYEMQNGIPKAPPEWLEKSGGVLYRADGECCDQIPECQCATDDFKLWRPSIHMPRWASRITLELIGVRVERLHDISEEDAEAEGMDRSIINSGDDTSFIPSFADLWAGINGADSWNANPWVWVLSFRTVEADR
jgi:hypothetical protein